MANKKESKVPLIGAHMSIAGGYHKAVERGAEAGCDVIQIFTKNNNQWRAKPITEEESDEFKSALAIHQIQQVLSHASYLINLASPKPDLLEKSIDAMVIELERAHQLGIPHVVVHPGSHTTSTEEEGIAQIAKSINTVYQKANDCPTIILLENVAGQGTNIGWQWEQLASIIEQTGHHDRLGICIDTCHTFAAGHPLDPEPQFEDTVSDIDRILGIDRVQAIHLNDSKKPFASRRDRHEHIGQGEMGLGPFRLVLNHKRLKTIPMYLETPKGEENGQDLDVMNLQTLRSLIK